MSAIEASGALVSEVVRGKVV